MSRELESIRHLTEQIPQTSQSEPISNFIASISGDIEQYGVPIMSGVLVGVIWSSFFTEFLGSRGREVTDMQKNGFFIAGFLIGIGGGEWMMAANERLSGS